MIFGPSKRKCFSCKKSYRDLPEEVSIEDRTQIEVGVAESRFVCPRCNISFHGKCGKVGKVNPKTATLTCPKCSDMFKSELPFQITKEKIKREQTLDEFIEMNDPLNQ